MADEREEEAAPTTAPAPVEKARSRWLVVAIAVLVLAVGTWALWDMRPTKTPATEPSAKLKILGRDDPATLRQETELNARPHSSAAASASTSPSGSAAPQR